MKREYTCWVLTYQFKGCDKFMVGVHCWPLHVVEARGVATFATRAHARKAQATCCYKPTRVERVRVTMETIGGRRKAGNK